jgi:hypothetical protein
MWGIFENKTPTLGGILFSEIPQPKKFQKFQKFQKFVKFSHPANALRPRHS